MPKIPPKQPSTRAPAPGSNTHPGPDFVDVTLRVEGSTGSVTRITIADHQTVITGNGTAHTSQLAGTYLPLAVTPPRGLHVLGSAFLFVPSPPDGSTSVVSDAPGVPPTVRFMPGHAATATFTLKPD